MAAGGVAAAMRGVTARKLAGLLKGDLDAIALKALKKPPGERYVTADAFEADIARYLRGEVVLVIGAAPAEHGRQEDALQAVRELIAAGAKARAAAGVVARLTGTRANDLYRRLTTTDGD